MSKSQLYIPTKLKVGYNERKDTYTGKLAFVICYDTKGKLRSEVSWKGWIDKGNPTGQTYVENKGWVNMSENIRPPLETHDYDNVPTSGFVLNKKAGGTNSGWNHRQMKCRVYDPRGFEFEIAIDNLLFILQESNSFKGKGLEGEFVYAWSGKDIVLLPTESEDYKLSKGFTSLQTKSVKAKDLVPGYVYETKKQNKLTFLGKLDWHDMSPIKDTSRRKYNYIHQTTTTKEFVFINEKNELEVMSSIANLAQCVVPTVAANFSDLMDIYTNSINSSKPVDLLVKDVVIDFKESETTNSHSHYYIEQSIAKKMSDNKYLVFDIYNEAGYVYEKLPDGSNDYSKNQQYKLLYYRLVPRQIVQFKDGVITKDNDYSKVQQYTFKEIYKNPNHKPEYAHNSYYSTHYSEFLEREKQFQKEDIINLNYKELYVSLENGKEIPFKKYN